jgi:hypothetical protein
MPSAPEFNELPEVISSLWIGFLDEDPEALGRMLVPESRRRILSCCSQDKNEALVS